MALVAGLAEKLINASSKGYQNYTFGAWADTDTGRVREKKRCEDVLVSLREQAEWN